MRAALLLGVLTSSLAFAGEQLSLAELVARADAIAVVEHTAGKKQDTLTVKAWLRGAQGDAAVSPASWLGLCVPSSAELRAWLARYPKHPGRETWARALKEGRREQVVFLTRRTGVVKPTCETEVLLARTFSTHADYSAVREELDELLRPDAGR